MDTGEGPVHSKIRHSSHPIGRSPEEPSTGERPSGFGASGGGGGGELEALPVAEAAGPRVTNKLITAFGKDHKHEDEWKRKPNTTGAGAIHVKTFHSKLTDDALAYMDQTINEWLDAHPEYEVKFVTSTVGTLTGKLKEPHLICQVWV